MQGVWLYRDTSLQGVSRVAVKGQHPAGGAVVQTQTPTGCVAVQGQHPAGGVAVQG